MAGLQFGKRPGEKPQLTSAFHKGRHSRKRLFTLNYIRYLTAFIWRGDSPWFVYG